MSREAFISAVCGGVLAAIGLAGPVSAACTPDPQGDFLATYTGPHVGEVDIRCIDVRLQAGVFKITVKADDIIGGSGKSYFVLGINRGAGIPRLQFIGAPPPLRPDLNFDAILLAYTNGPPDLSVLPPPNFVSLPGAVSISGDTLTAWLPLSYLPSTGFTPENYEFTVWTDYQVTGQIGDANNNYIPDFSSTIHPSVPEPASWAMMLGGFGAIGGAMRSRRKAAVAFG